jgi:hypothetical protein
MRQSSKDQPPSIHGQNRAQTFTAKYSKYAKKDAVDKAVSRLVTNCNQLQLVGADGMVTPQSACGAGICRRSATAATFAGCSQAEIYPGESD